MGGNTFGRRLGVIVAAMCALMLIGTLGYTFIESWPIRDGFYMTVITFSTVGYGETQELSQAGRTFTSAFIILCLVTMALWSATLTSCLVEGDLTGRFNERKNRKMISRLKGHTVICGSNAIVGALVAKLLDGGTEVVVIDSDESQVEQLKTTYRKVLTVVGDPTNELTLASTNILDAATVM